jgi:hypothetical protein
VQRSPRQHELSSLVNVWVGQIHDEERIVFRDHGIEKKGSGIAQFEQEAGKESRSFMVETFLTHAGRLNIAVRIEDRKRFAIF